VNEKTIKLALVKGPKKKSPEPVWCVRPKRWGVVQKNIKRKWCCTQMPPIKRSFNRGIGAAKTSGGWG